jgi:hypothetical protein
MSSTNHNDDSNVNACQQAELEKQIAQIENAALQQKRFERLGCAAILALPVAFFAWRIGSIVIGMSEAADFERRAAVTGVRVRFWFKGEGVKGVSTVAIGNQDFSDNDMVKLAPFLVEAESFGSLYLSRTEITDKGLKYFPAGVKLGRIDFRNTHVTRAGIDLLLLRLPQLQNSLIIFDGGSIQNNIVSLPDDSN